LQIRFRVCRWLEREEFLEIIRWANYLGREAGCSVFTVNVGDRLIDNLEDIMERIKSIGGEVDPSDEAKIRQAIRDSYRVEVHPSPKGYLLKSRRLLADYLWEFRERGLVYYSREQRGFIVKPYAIIDVIDRLEAEGFTVEDATGLISGADRVDIEFVGELRRYQLEALESWVKNRYRGVVVLPTGAGKTIVALASMAKLRVPTLIVVYTKEQMFEWIEKILKFTNLRRSDIGLYYSDEKRIGRVTIATYQSAYRHISSFYDKFSLIVIDEAHHLPADKFRLIAEQVLAPYRLALSATPYRSDGRHEDLFRLVGGIVYSKTVQELASMGFIASFEIIPVLVNLSPSERLEFNRLKREYNVLAAGRRVEELVRAASSGDEKARRALQLLNRIRKMLAFNKSKIEEAKRIIEQELSRGSKIIVFTQYIDQAERIGKLVGAPVITGKTDKRRRQLILELFKAGRYRVLVFTTVGDEGIDVPDANVGIILSGTSSKRQFIQRLGRLLRPKEGKQSRLYYIAVRGTSEEATLRKLASEVGEELGYY
jgi:superfamily II DNA or RNA helicase